MIGGECAYCQYTTFLPIKCQFCKKEYCERHYQPGDHRCPKYITHKHSTEKSKEQFKELNSLRCIYPKCRNCLTFACSTCGKNICAYHRFPHSETCQKQN